MFYEINFLIKMRVSGLLTILFCGFDFFGNFVWFWTKKFFIKRETGRMRGHA